MNNEERTRIENLERQVFGMTHDKWIEARQNFSKKIPPEVIKKIHDNIVLLDPQGSRFMFRVRKIFSNYGLSDGHMTTVFGIIKAVYEDRRQNLYDIEPARVDYSKPENSLWDNLIDTANAKKLGYELEEIRKRLDLLES